MRRGEPKRTAGAAGGKMGQSEWRKHGGKEGKRTAESTTLQRERKWRSKKQQLQQHRDKKKTSGPHLRIVQDMKTPKGSYEKAGRLRKHRRLAKKQQSFFSRNVEAANDNTQTLKMEPKGRTSLNFVLGPSVAKGFPEKIFLWTRWNSPFLSVRQKKFRLSKL